jgi:cytochrome c2
MKNSGIVWDDSSLDRLLATPQKLVPGSFMKDSVADPADRADIIAYLETLKR